MNSTVGGATLAAPGAVPTADATYYQAATQSNITAATAAISNALKFATSKSIRTSTIILASFNAFAAFITAVGIIHSCRQYHKRMQRRASDPPPSGLFYIHTVEVFPLLLSLGTTIQSITFAAAQSVGLQALLSRGCTIVAIAMMPALFLVPFTHLVFGVETALRGVRSNFAPRGKWNITICLGIVGAMSLVTLIVAIVERAPDFCFASLFWFIRTYSTGGFAVFATVATITLIVMGTIFLKLNRSHTVSPTERVAATRMIYYLALGFISEVFIMPFFFSITFLDQQKEIWNTLNLGMVSAVVANVNGLMVAGLHLFLRSQNNNSICQELGEYERKKSVYDHDPRDDHRGSNHSLQPVNRSNSRARSDSSATLLHATNTDERGFPSPMSYGTARSPFSPKLNIPSGPAYPEPTQPPSETSPSQIRKQSYSLYPNDQPPAAAAVLPATTYSPMTSRPTRDTWKPPPIVKPWMGRGHKRDSSITSTATVQIGIRLSNVDDYVPRKSTDTDVPDVPDVPDPRTMPTIRSSQFADYEMRTASDYSDYAGTDIILADPPSRPSSKDSRMKTLPPVPRSSAIAVNTNTDADNNTEAVSPVSPVSSDDEQGSTLITLSPTVYQDPVELSRSGSNRSMRKLPSPLGVGFSSPNGRLPGDPRLAAVVAPPRPSGSAATTPIPTTKADWI